MDVQYLLHLTKIKSNLNSSRPSQVILQQSQHLRLSDYKLPTLLQMGLNFCGGKVFYNFKVDAGLSILLLSNFKRNYYSENMI